MARAWIVDRWVKDAIVTLPDGSTTRISATREQKRSMKSLPEHFRTTRWMQGRRWRVNWHEAGLNGPEARSKSFEARLAAEAFAAELEDDIRRGRYIDPSGQDRLFREIAAEWLESKKKLKEASRLRYREVLDTHILPKWGSVRIGAITHRSIVTWVTELTEGTSPTSYSTKKTSPKLAPSTIKYIVKVGFGSIIRYAIRARLISEDPLEGIELPSADVEEVAELRTLSHQGIEALAARAEEVTGKHQDHVLIRLDCYSGPRINEILAFKVQDVLLARKRVKILRTWTKAESGGWKLGPPKTWQKREIPIPDFLVPELRKLMKGKKPTDWLFADEHGEAIEYKWWYNHVWLKSISIDEVPAGFVPHDMRHTAATLAIAAGADVKVIQQMLGHASSEETTNTYGHLWHDRLDEVMDALTKHRAKAIGVPDSTDDTHDDEVLDAAA